MYPCREMYSTSIYSSAILYLHISCQLHVIFAHGPLVRTSLKTSSKSTGLSSKCPTGLEKREDQVLVSPDPERIQLL